MYPKNILLQWQEKLILIIQVWILILGLIIFLITICCFNIYSFLALTSPIKADILIVEGWMSDYAVKLAIAEFQQGAYQKLITTGSPIGKGYYLSEYNNFAELTAATLITLGFDPDRVVTIPTPQVVKYRTAASAIAVKEWLTTSNLKVDSINIYTLGPHARRSWMIYRNILSPDIQVGVIALEPKDYNPHRWWQSSAGMRTVVGEAIAYFYTRFVNWTS
ncbi:MAG: YdcF family protein [Okeania sp. SIO2G4]|uniref:ElyC/SanA/YdcF family protein n=1 Tax=unclassified Okeania TaxID=2634635 RepID=UPI0013B9AD4A|nr:MULTISPECIES: ElyC/SanA/YdcF family protein [unclassified Okeania]NEP06050.1 YdcF family protein [Okeania sp. SIO4D6]NEP71200.1 YdcF family protein [Okeania sp. SIO2G5]NEP92113.1 YdcF family protein [Okeania sp. SIO2F5]NEQ90869.1 YdcF family protein [Okeania sp. SIO2G4]